VKHASKQFHIVGQANLNKNPSYCKRGGVNQNIGQGRKRAK